MNDTLNNLALFSFRRKARKLNKNIAIIDFTHHGYLEHSLVVKGETLILWGEENGFHTIFANKDTELYYFGILNLEQTKLCVYRCYEQAPYRKDKVAFGLQFNIEESELKGFLQKL